MAKVIIELDLSVVERAIKAEVNPAVRDVLARHYDIPAMISEQLLREPDKDKKPRATSLGWPGLYEERPATGRAAIEAAIRSAINSAAEEYVQVVMDERRDAIYAAFKKMMADSPDRLANAFVEMIEGADLSFALSAELSILDR